MKKAPLVGGVVPVTTVDYPGHIASVIFLQGCSWRCEYCHNQHLQNVRPTFSLPWVDILHMIKFRAGFIEGVVFSGGEPLLQNALEDAIIEIKNLGLKVAIHTSGPFPNKLAKILPIVDWVGFDIKHTFEDYHKITRIPDSGKLALESLKILIESNVDFEVRMTLHDSIEVSSVVEVMHEISFMGVKTVALQKCRDKKDNVIEHLIFSDKILLEDISKRFDNFFIRG